jgi:hypothetical protein
VVGARLSQDRPAVRLTAAVPNRVALLDAPPARVEPRPADLPEPDPLPQELTDAFGDDAVQETGPAMLDGRLGLESDAQAGFDAFGLRARLRIWVDGERRIARCVLADSSGQPQVDGDPTLT